MGARPDLKFPCTLYTLQGKGRAISHTRPWARDHELHFKRSHWWRGQSRSKFASHYAWGTNGVYTWTQDGCEVYMDSYVASNGSCFMVIWTISINRLLEVGLTQNRGDHGTPNAHNRWFIFFYHVWGSIWIEIHEIAFGWGPLVMYDFTLHLRVRDRTTSWFWKFGAVLGQVLIAFFWALTIAWSRLLACVWSGPKASFILHH